MITLTTPIKKSDISKLKAGDEIMLNGTIFTARDKAHAFFLKKTFPQIENGILYHCGPIVKNDSIISAGPTTSFRMNNYTPEVIKKYGIKIIIGKGGMDENVLEALRGQGVYLSAIGGAAALYADKMKLKNTYKKEFGSSEAIYELEVKDFPLIVSMDSKGNSLYAKIYKQSKNILNKKLNEK